MSSAAGHTHSTAGYTSSAAGRTSLSAGCTGAAIGHTRSAIRCTGVAPDYTDSAFGYIGATASHVDSAAGDTGVASGFVGAAAAGSAVRYKESQLSPCRTDRDLTLVMEREVDKANPEEILSLLQGAELKEHVEDDATNSLKIKVSDISYLLPLNFFILIFILFERFY
jgi:hypothetical protein